VFFLKLILVTSSPRRIELIRKLSLPFEIRKPNEEQDIYVPKNPCLTAILRAKFKVKNLKVKDDEIVVSADTIIVLGDNILGKPKDVNEAREYLKMLSGRTHKVITALLILTSEDIYTECVKTKVTFKKLSKEEIEFYVRTKEPLDKAGAYAIQGLGALFVRRIEGDYYNIMGLPLNRLYSILKKYVKQSDLLKS